MSKKLHQFLNFVAIPFAISFTFDLTLQRHLFLFFVLVAGSALLNGSAAFVAACWQGLCVAAFISLFFSLCASKLFNPSIALLLFVVILCVIIFFKRMTHGDRGIFQSVDIKRDSSALLFITFMALRSPHGDFEKFLSILAEDNEGWVRAPLNLMRSNQIDLSFSLDTLSIQYFVNFSLTIFTRIFGEVPSFQSSDQSIAIHVVANSWQLVLVSGILLTLFLTADLWVRVLGHRKSVIVYSVIGIFQIGFFNAALLNGHFAQLLLNVVVSVLSFSLVEMILFRCQKLSLVQAVFAFTASCALVGSYNPWIAISIGSIGIVILFYPRKNLFLRLARSRLRVFYLGILLFGLAFFYMELSDRYGMLDEAGGIWVVGLRSLTIYGLVFVYLAISAIIAKHCELTNGDRESRSSSNELNERLLIVFFVLSVFVIAEDSKNVYLHLLILVVGAMFTKRCFSEFQVSKNRTIQDKTYIPVLLLCGGSGFFVAYVWLASLISGPVYAPMYAAHKSLLAFSGQFYWLALCFAFLNTYQKLSLTALRNLIVGTVFLSFSGLQPLLINGRQFEVRTTVKDTWWIEPMIEVYHAKGDATLICIDGELGIDNFSVYNCNRFSSSLSEVGTPAAHARFFALGQKDRLKSLIGSIIAVPSDRDIIILSFGMVTPEARAVFDLTKRNIKIIEVQI